MLNRRRIRNDKKLNNSKILIGFCIIMFFLGTAYSSINQVLTLDGSGKIYNSTTDHGHLKKGNIDAYIVKVANIWKTADGWNIDMTIRVHNPNNFNTTNWDATILVPGLKDASSYNLNDLKLDPENELIIVTNVDGSDQGRLKIDETRDYGMKVVASNVLIEEVIKILSEEEKALMTQSDKNAIYGGGTDALSSKFKEAVISKLIYNMDAVPEPTPNVIEIVANTNYEAEYELENFSYTCGDLAFNVIYSSYERWDGRYVTTAEIQVTNNNKAYNVNKFGFDMKYNEPMSEEYYKNVTGNSNNDGNGTTFPAHTNINVKDKTINYAAIESFSYDSLKPGETKTYHVSQIITNKKFKSFVFDKVSYTLSNGSTGGSTSTNTTNTNTTSTNTITNTVTNTTTNTITNTVANTITNTTIEPEEPINPLEFSYSYEKLNWGYNLVNATVTIKNTSDKEIKNCKFDLYYNSPLSEARYNDVTSWHPVEILEKTKEYISLKTLTSINANGELKFTIQKVEAETGFSDFIVKNIVCEY